MALAAYLDESRLPLKQFYTVAGCVLDAAAVKSFERRWKKALDSLTPPLQRFHATDYAKGWGEFKDRQWSDTQRRRYFGRLLSIMGKSIMVGGAVTLDLKAWDTLTVEDRQALGGDHKPPYTPYAICTALLCSNVVAKMPELGERGEIAYYLDDVRDPTMGKGRLKHDFEIVRQDPQFAARLRVKSVSWVKSVEVPGIQAADIVAYEMGQAAATHVGNSTQSIRDEARRLMAAMLGPRLMWLHLDAAELRALAADIRARLAATR